MTHTPKRASRWGSYAFEISSLADARVLKNPEKGLHKSPKILKPLKLVAHDQNLQLSQMEN